MQLGALNSAFDVGATAKTLVEYVFLVGGERAGGLRSLTRVLDLRPSCVKEVPALSTVGESDQELLLKPNKLFPDPFRSGGLLVLCEAFATSQAPFDQAVAPAAVLQPHAYNHRAACAEVLRAAEQHIPAFACEQEYCVLPVLPDETAYRTAPAAHPYCFGDPIPQSPKPSAVGRRLAERHLSACLRAGIQVSEIAARDGSPSSHGAIYDTPASATRASRVWSYKLSPQLGLDFADQLWVSRFLLHRAAEAEGVRVSLDPLSAGLEFGLLRCYVEYSTLSTRHMGLGLEEAQGQLLLLHAARAEHAAAYGAAAAVAASCRGAGGAVRAAAAASPLRVGVAMPTAAAASSSLDLIIPAAALLQRTGHLLDCRPAACADPYIVVSLLVSTTLQVPFQPSGQAPAPAAPAAQPAAAAVHPLPFARPGGRAAAAAAVAGQPLPFPHLHALAAAAAGARFSPGGSGASGLTPLLLPFSPPSPAVFWPQPEPWEDEEGLPKDADMGLTDTASLSLLIEELDHMDGYPPIASSSNHTAFNHHHHQKSGQQQRPLKQQQQQLATQALRYQPRTRPCAAAAAASPAAVARSPPAEGFGESRGGGAFAAPLPRLGRPCLAAEHHCLDCYGHAGHMCRVSETWPGKS